MWKILKIKKGTKVRYYLVAKNVIGFLAVVLFFVVLIAFYTDYNRVAKQAGELAVRLDEQNELLLQMKGSLDSAVTIQEDLVLAVADLQENSGIAEENFATLKDGIEDRREQAEAQDITIVAKAWSNRVARVRCTLTDDDDGSESQAIASGVGFYIGNTLHVMTNKHVLEEKRETLEGCVVEFPQHNIDNIEVDDSAITISKDRDIAYLRVDDPRASISINQTQKACSAVPEIGDRVITLGFPRVGAKDSITVTDGIISGLEKDFYITSAKIESGNSGGAAILTKNNCFVGLPTLVVVGRIESLARILPVTTLSGMDL